MVDLYVGSYPSESVPPDDPGGPGYEPSSWVTGSVWSLGYDPEGERFSAPALVASASAPSFLAFDPAASHRSLYAASETYDGAMAVWPVGSDGIPGPAIAREPSGGSYPCHVTIAGGAAWIANYGDGALGVVPLGPDGLPGSALRVFAGEGSGPDPERQAGPHAHMACAVPGQDAIWVVDLGADVIRRYYWRRDTASPVPEIIDAGIALTVPAGTGPRHVAFLSEDRAILVGELDPVAFLLAVDPATAAAQIIGTARLAEPAGEQRVYPAHVAKGTVPGRAYVGLRGSGELAVLQVARQPDGEALTVVGRIGLPGDWPRHHEVISCGLSDHVVVALERSDAIVAVRVPADGSGVVGGDVVAQAWIPAPACVLAS